MYNYSNEPLTKERLMGICPSAFATVPHSKVSDKYVLINTIDVVDKLETLGYFPVTASESNVRLQANAGTQMHTVRFRKPEFFDIEVDDIAPEFVWVNSHNRRMRAKGMLGLFRKVCSNGLCVSESTLSSVNAKHIGIESGEIEELVYTHASMSDEVLEKVNDYKKVNLSIEQKYVFAQQAHKAIWTNGNSMEPTQLLEARREVDKADDLFTVYNVVQENVVQGGIEYKTPKRKVKTRGIKSIKADIDINLILWGLLDQTYKNLK